MADAKNKPATGNRLAKVIARAGLCSRREAEEWINAGRVTVNGKPVRTPAFNVAETDKIEVDKEPLVARSGTRVWLYHKPAGLVVTEKDPEGRETIFQALEKNGLPRFLTVGRLDINTEGLLLLTNDGGLKRVLELPATGWLRRYRVRAHGRITQEQLDTLKKGMTVEGVKYGPIDASLERVQGGNVWLMVALREGKNREVKIVLEALGLQVNRLIRTSYGPFQLGDLPIGGVTVVRARVLRDQLGAKLAEEAGVDFTSPLPGEEETDVSKVARDPGRRLKKTETGELAPEMKPRGRTGEPKVRAADKPRKNAPERKGNFEFKRRPDKPVEPVEKRIVHFTDGRESEEFEPKAEREKPKDDFDGGRRPPRGGDRGDKRASGGRSFGDRPRGDDRPRTGRSDGPRGDRPAGDRPRTGAGRPARDDGGRSFGDRPRTPRSDGPRSDRPAGDRPRTGAGRPARDDGGRGFGDRPRTPRSDGPRGDRPSGDRPRTSGGRPDSRSDSRPGGDRPRGGDARGAGARSSGPRGDGPKSAGPRSGPSRSGPPKAGAPRSGAPRSGPGKPAGPRGSGPRSSSPRSSGPRPGGAGGPRKGPGGPRR